MQVTRLRTCKLKCVSRYATGGISCFRISGSPKNSSTSSAPFCQTNRAVCRVLMIVVCCLASFSASGEAVAGRMCHQGYGPAKTLDNRWKRWCAAGVFERIFAALAHGEGRPVHADDRCAPYQNAPDRSERCEKTPRAGGAPARPKARQCLEPRVRSGCTINCRSRIRCPSPARVADRNGGDALHPAPQEPKGALRI